MLNHLHTQATTTPKVQATIEAENGSAKTKPLASTSSTCSAPIFCIEHRLAPPKSPQTDVMVERFNGRINQMLKTNRCNATLDLDQTLIRYLHI